MKIQFNVEQLRQNQQSAEHAHDRAMSIGDQTDAEYWRGHADALRNLLSPKPFPRTRELENGERV